jgi:hypothetical protein
VQLRPFLRALTADQIEFQPAKTPTEEKGSEEFLDYWVAQNLGVLWMTLVAIEPFKSRKFAGREGWFTPARDSLAFNTVS